MSRWGVINAPNYGLRQVKVGVWAGDGTYTGVVTIAAAQLLNTSLTTVKGELEGNDVILDSHAQIVKGQARLRVGAIDLPTLAVLTGQTLTTTGSTPNRKNKMKFTGRSMRYFGIIGLSGATDGVGGVVVFAAKCKIVSDFVVTDMENGKYTIPDVTIDILPDDFYTTTGVNEIQTATITGGPAGGTFTLTFDGYTTSALAYNASSASIQTALEALASIGTGNVSVSGSAGGPYTITFISSLAYTDVSLITATSSLTGGTSPAIAVTLSTAGVIADPIVLDVELWETKPTMLTLPPVA